MTRYALDALKNHALHGEAPARAPLTAAATGWAIVLALCLPAPAPTEQQIAQRQREAARQGVESPSIAHARDLYRQRAIVAKSGRPADTRISAVH